MKGMGSAFWAYSSRIGQPQGQVELELGAFTHLGVAKGMVGISPSDQTEGVAFVKLLLHAGETIWQLSSGEQVASLLQQRLFLLTAVLLNRVGQQYLAKRFTAHARVFSINSASAFFRS